MNIFKRSLSALLVLIMIVTAVPMGAIAVSAETTNGDYIYLDTTVKANISHSFEKTVLYFVPNETGVYTFASEGDIDVYCSIYDSNGVIIAEDDDSGEGRNFSVSCKMNAGEKYEIQVYGWGNVTGEFYISASKFAIASVECEPITIIENCNGEMIKTTDDNGETVEYYSYQEAFPFGFTVTMTDGSVYESGPYSSFEHNGIEYYPNFRYGQNYEERWSLGSNTGSFSINGVEFYYEANVVESPIADIICDPSVSIVKNTNGFYNQDSHYSEENGWEYSPQYYYYYPYPNNTTLVLKDGTEYDLSSKSYVFYWEGFYYSCGIFTDQSYENQWREGTHSAMISVGNYNRYYDVEIFNTPIASIDVKPVKVVEYSKGHMSTSVEYDEETGEFLEYEYYCYTTQYPSEYTITLIDGTVYENTGFYWDGVRYDIAINAIGQSHNNTLGIGKHTVNAYIEDFEFTYEMEIVEAPVLELNVPVTVGRDIYGQHIPFKFVPQVSGNYLFSSSGASGAYCEVLDENGNVLIINSNNGSDHNNFKLGCYMEAGKEYTLFVTNGGAVYDDYTVILEVAPVISVVADDVIIIENTSLDLAGDMIDDKYYEYYVYGNYYPKNYTVTMIDGSVINVTDNSIFYWNGEEYNLSYYESDQSYNNQWGVGTHTAYGSIGGCGFEYNVVIVETPVEAVYADKAKGSLLSSSSGYYKWDEYWNEDTQCTEYSPEYFYYHAPALKNVTVVLKDGTVLENADDGFRWNGRWYSVTAFDIEQSYKNQLGLGTHKGKANIAGFEFVYEYEIVDGIIASVNIPTIVIYKNTNGYFCTETVWDEKTQTETEVTYYCYYFPEITNMEIEVVDGTVYNNDGFWYAGNHHYLDIDFPEQNAESHLDVGVYTLKGSISGFDFTFDLEIRNSPEIYVDTPVTVDHFLMGRNVRYSFTPSVSGVYTVTSLGSVDDPQCYIYDDKESQICYDDNSGDDMNFSAGCYMEAGRTYIIIIDGRQSEGEPYTVIVEGSPIVSVTVDDVRVIEKTHGYKATYTTEEGGIAEYYYYSDIYPDSFTVTMKDGSEIYVSDNGGFEWNGKWYGIEIYTNQGYKEQWDVGVNTAYGSVGGHEFTFNVVIEESPIASVTVNKRVIIQYTNGYYDSGYYYNEETGNWEYSEYYRYWTPSPSEFVIVMKDGTVYENDIFKWNGQWEGFSLEQIEQSCENPLGLGTYTVEINIAGYDLMFEFEIAQTPVASVEIYDVYVLENTNGDYEWDEIWNEEEGYYENSPEYFYYYAPVPRNYKVTMKDGTVYENSMVYWDGSYYGLSYGPILVNGEQQNYYNQATPGVHTVEGNILGFDYTYNVVIEETPVESVYVPSVQIAENTNGHYETDWIWNEETQNDEAHSYFYYYNISPRSAVITLKDGTVINGTNFDWNGNHYYIEVTYNQNYKTRLLPGINEISYTIAGYASTYDVEISSVSSNEFFEYLKTSSGIVITDCYLNTETIEIPSTIEGVPVIGIAEFDQNYNNVKKFIIPDSVETIGDWLLSSMPNLESVEIGAGVRNLYAEMFTNNYNLTTLTVDAKNENYKVVNGVLYNADVTSFIALPVASMDALIVPKTCVDIEGIYYDIYRNIEISFEEGHAYYVTVDGVTYNKDMTKVEFCSKNYVGDYVMPDTVTDINSMAFYNIDGLTSVVVSDQVTEIVYATFASCKNLKSVELPEGLVSIGMYAFRDTPLLDGVVLPETLMDIGNGAFEISGIKSISIPDSCEYISYNAFKNSRIETLDLGEGVVEIDSMAFGYTPLKAVAFPDSLMTLGSSAFYGCQQLKKLEIGSSLNHIPSNAFALTGLESVVLPENVQYIGSSAFRHSSLKNIEFKNPGVYVGSWAFSGCPLDSLVLGDEMTEIAQGAFAQTSIKMVDIPDSVTSIVYQAFMDCEDLSDISIPENVVEIGGHTFDNTAWYNTHADGVMYLDHAVYSWKGKMPENTAVQMKEGTTIIADYAFQHQSNLSSVTLPETLEIIGDYAFYGCTSLESIHIPANVRSIGDDVFLGCMSLKNITVDPANDCFYVENGVLRSVNGYKLYDINTDYGIADIWVNRYPNKSTYLVGEEFDPTGLRVTLYYNNGYREIVEKDWESYGIELEGFVSDSAGECIVNVLYMGEICDSLWIEIIDKNVTPEIPEVTDKYWEIPVYFKSEYSDSSSLSFDIEYDPSCSAIVDIVCGFEHTVVSTGNMSATVTVEDMEELKDYNEGEVLFVIIVNTPSFIESLDEVRVVITDNYDTDGDGEPSEIVPGDVTGDNAVNAKDANIVKRIIAGAVEALIGSDIFKAADLNGDGAVNAKDANLLKRLVAGAL